MDVVLYMRYSSDKQTEQSIEGQRRICMDFCIREGYNVVDSYIDRATSAFKDTDKRTEFQRMIKDSEKGLFHGVVVYKLDRFARNRYDSATYKARLKKNGVRVISATENISDNPEGVILESVLEGMAEFYSKELSQKITRGMHESALKGYTVGGRVPLGYKLENKKLIIDPAGAEIVKQAFRMYSAGSTIAEIITTFNNRGYRTTTGAEFNKNSFKSMLRNERYIGLYKYKDIRIDNGVPAIIEKELFDAVQAKLSSNAEAPARSKAKVDYLLAQKLFCGHCGATMTGETGHGKSGKAYHYYTCSNRKNHSTCDKKAVAKDTIERIVVQDTIELLTPDLIDHLADVAVKAAEDELLNNRTIPALESEKDEIERSIANLIKMVERGVISDSISNRLVELENQKRDVEKRLLLAKDDIVILEKDMVVYWLSQFLQGEIDDPDFRRHVIDLLVNSVTIWDDPDGWKITIAYNLTPEKSKTITCSDLEGNAPPLEYNPNSYQIIIGFNVFLYTRKHPIS